MSGSEKLVPIGEDSGQSGAVISNIGVKSSVSKAWLKRLILIVFGASLGIIGLQSFLAQFCPYPVIPNHESFYQRDPVLGWKLIPHKTRGRTVVGRIALDQSINSEGFRDAEHTFNKPGGVFRIVLIGDSFCDQLEMPTKDLFHQVLARKLNSAVDKPVELINLGIGGFGTAQEYLALKHYGFHYDPDLVLLAFFIGNDVHDNALTWQAKSSDATHTTRPFFVLKEGNLQLRQANTNPESIVPAPTLLEEAKRYLYEYLPDIAYPVRNNVIVDKVLRAAGLTQDVAQSTAGAQSVGSTEVDPELALYLAHYPPEVEEAWEVTKGLILKIADEVRAHGSRFLFVLIPNEFEFKARDWSALLEQPAMSHFAFDLKKPERILTQLLDANHIEYLLLRPGFEQYINENGSDLNYHRPGDGHWNPEGHALAADLIYQKVVHNEALLKRLSNDEIEVKRGVDVTSH